MKVIGEYSTESFGDEVPENRSEDRSMGGRSPCRPDHPGIKTQEIRNMLTVTKGRSYR
ncbi:MAG: hypothetical protein QM390_03640 [Candidatus Thermoplasmatota archaeon]|nr:hypothetical protein [Candidatus Methanomethylophilaceae archaeon]MDI9378788.1 hypothetical protein [Candidatus Thermoplasmatota archaeon]